MVTVVLRSMGDKERDILRMRRIYGMLISEPGDDRFAFYVIERNRGYRLEFPSDTTDFSDDLKARLDTENIFESDALNGMHTYDDAFIAAINIDIDSISKIDDVSEVILDFIE